MAEFATDAFFFSESRLLKFGSWVKCGLYGPSSGVTLNKQPHPGFWLNMLGALQRETLVLTLTP